MPYSGRHRSANGVNNCDRGRLRIYPLLAVSSGGERTSMEYATGGGRKVRSRRNVVIAGRFGEGPITEPTAAAHPPADKSDGVGHQRRSRDRESRRRTWRNKLLGQALSLRCGSQMYRSACGSDLHAD
jgi:hypothetical protein